MSNDDTIDSNILDDDELINLDKTREIMGGISISTAYEDPELMALKISMTPPGSPHPHGALRQAQGARSARLSASRVPKQTRPRSAPRSRPASSSAAPDNVNALPNA